MINYTLTELKDDGYKKFINNHTTVSKKREVRCTYNKLVEILGSPITEMNESYNEWWITHDGFPITVYDTPKVYNFTYKQDEMINWNIGAINASMFLVNALIDAINQNLPIKNFLDKDDEDYQQELDSDD